MFTQSRSILILLLLLSLLVIPIQAQDDLQQVTADDGSFSFSLPAGWLLSDDMGGGLVVGTSEAALQSAENSDPVPAGDAVIYVLGPNFFVELYDISPDESLDTALQMLIDSTADYGGLPEFGDIQYVDMPDGRSLVGVEATESSPLDGGLGIMPGEGSGFVGAMLVTPAGEVAPYEDIYFNLLLSLQGGPPTASGPLPEPTPTAIPGQTDSGPVHVVAADGTFNFDLPAGWLTVDSGSVIIAATSQGAIASLDSSDPVPTGEAVIVVMGPTFFAGQFGISPGAVLGDVLQTVLDEMGDDPNWPDFDEVQFATLPDGRALAGVDALDSSPLDGALAVIAADGSGYLGALIITPAGDVDQYEDIYFEMLQSLHSGATNEPQGTTLADTGELIEQWASSATGTSEYTSTDWGFIQVTGAPDTKGCEDVVTAWASATATGSDILALTFDQAVYPTQINIRQTLAPGSIVQVEVANSAASGQSILIPNSADPPGNTPCPGTFTLDVTDVNTPVDRVIIYFDQTIGGTWNEIDAVQLIGTLAATAPAGSDKTEATATEQPTAVPTVAPTAVPATPVKGAGEGSTTETPTEAPADSPGEEVVEAPAATGERFELALNNDGMFGINTLQDWAFGTVDGIIEINSAPGSGSIPADIIPVAGEVFIQIVPPEILNTLGIVADDGEDRAAQLIGQFVAWRRLEELATAPYSYTDPPGAIAEMPAPTLEPAVAIMLLNYSLLTDGETPELSDRPTPESGDAAVIALEKEGALFLVAVYGDIASREAQVGALLDSITLQAE